MSKYSIEEMKEILTVEAEKITKSLMRETAVLRELTNDTNAYDAVLVLEAGEDPIDPATGYDSFTEWKEHLSKQMKTSETSLANIDVDKVILGALQYFIENAA